MSPVDQHVARRLRGKRRALGLSIDELAVAVHIAAERIELYESAAASVPHDHLVRLGEFLGVPVAFFLPADRCSTA